MFDLLELQEELVGVLVLPAAVRPLKDGFAGSLRIVWTFRACSSKKGSA